MPSLPSPSPTLFQVVLGGHAPGCLVELHDVRFVAGESIEACLPELGRQWFGTRKGLHVDAYMAVRAIDGWSVSLVSEPPEPRAEQLWFVNLGGYRRDVMAEIHHAGLVVATSEQEARRIAKNRWMQDTLELHTDEWCPVDDCLAIDRVEPQAGPSWFIRLDPHPDGLSQPQAPDWFGYRPF